MSESEGKHKGLRRPVLPRAEWLIGLMLLLVIGFLGLLAVQVVVLSHDLRTANEARDALAAQVQGLGEKPISGPPGSRGEPGQSVVGPRGPKGAKGDPGAQGPAGPKGAKGDTGDDGTDGSAGDPGTDGSNGLPGNAGTDGASGPAGPAGPQGDPGPAGAQGEPGEPGTDGTDGQTCPDGYSLQAPSYDPDALVCRKDGAPDPEPSPDQPMAAGLDPSRRVYA